MDQETRSPSISRSTGSGTVALKGVTSLDAPSACRWRESMSDRSVEGERLMDDVAVVGKIYKGLFKASVELVCTSVDLYAKAVGETKSIADVMLFEMAKEIKMRPNGRAAAFVDHFLFGGGEDVEFSARTLLEEDAGVRKRVADEIAERVKKNPALKKKARMISGGDYVIPIRQRDYANSDWKNALGSFAIEWEFVDLMAEKNNLVAKVWGANEYKWHPAADRVTQCIHQAGDRLTRSKQIRARNFWMKASPALILEPTGKPIG